MDQRLSGLPAPAIRWSGWIRMIPPQDAELAGAMDEVMDGVPIRIEGAPCPPGSRHAIPESHDVPLPDLPK